MKHLALMLCALAGCTQHIDLGGNDGSVVDAGPAPDTLTLSGHFCTPEPNPATFPVKVLFLVQQSGSMCVLDPPGSQQQGTFCADALAPEASMLPSEPARVKALKKLFTTFAGQAGVSVALVPFDTQVKGVWPMVSGAGQSRFEPMTPTTLLDGLDRLVQLQSELGKASDYQSALAYAYGMVDADIQDLEATDPQQLARTRYVVVLVGDGLPFPRCTANDDLSGYATPDLPELTWPDSPGAGCIPGDPDAGTCYCNDVSPMDPDLVPGFVAGTDRNQFYQLMAYANQLKALQSSHRVADVRMHAVQLYDQDAQAACGTLCQDLVGFFTPPQAISIGQDLLSKLSAATGGTFIAATSAASLASLSLGALRYDSEASQSVAKTLMVRWLSSVPGPAERLRDSDGDGLPDAMESGISAQAADSDGDCFSDGFETRHASEGFDPTTKDMKGCDPASPLTPGCACTDKDGDGLSQFAESYLHTNPELADTDADGIPDGDEERWGLDPLAQNRGDTDGDLVSDLEEVRSGSDPKLRDTLYREAWPVSYQLASHPQVGGAVCYDFTVSGIPLVEGENFIALDKGLAPVSVASLDPGDWERACVHVTHTKGSAQQATLGADWHVAAVLTGDPQRYRLDCVEAR